MNRHSGKALLMGAVAAVLWASSCVGAGQLVRHDSHGWQAEYAATDPTAVKRYWPGAVEVRLHYVPGVYSMGRELEWALWSWAGRSGKDIKVGADVGSVVEGASGAVHVTFISDFDMFMKTWSLSTQALTTSWFYSDTGVMAGAVIYLKKSVFEKPRDNCAMMQLVHEVGHGVLGIDQHSADPADVMFSTGSAGCRYNVTKTDVELSGAKWAGCWAEANLRGDIYLPDVRGYSAELLHSGGYSWKLGAVSDGLDGGCNAVTIHKDLSLTINDLRTVGGNFTRADLQSFGADAWVLDYAE